MGIKELGISVFPSGLCPELLDDTNECQHILVHKIHLQLKLYHCNALLPIYISSKTINKSCQKPTIELAGRLGDILQHYTKQCSKE